MHKIDTLLKQNNKCKKEKGSFAMNVFIPINKQSKKQQKAYYSKYRNTWNGFNPVTRTVPNGKGYERNKQKQEDRRNGRLSQYYDDNCRFHFLELIL